MKLSGIANVIGKLSRVSPSLNKLVKVGHIITCCRFNKEGAMKSSSITKSVRRLIGQWNGIAHERELRTELTKLHQSFHDWEAGKLNSFDLSDSIHKFHDGPARDLYKLYAMDCSREDWLLSSAVSKGIVKREELPSQLVEALGERLTAFD